MGKVSLSVPKAGPTDRPATWDGLLLFVVFPEHTLGAYIRGSGL